MTALVLSLHLLGAPVSPPMLHLAPRTEASMHLLPALHAQSLGQTLGQPPPDLIQHPLGAEFLAGFAYALGTHLVAVAVMIPVATVALLFALVAVLGGGSGSVAIADALIIAVVVVAIADVLGVPALAMYAISGRHGDRSGGPLVLGYLGGLLGEFLGAIPMGILFSLFDSASSSSSNGALSLLVLIAGLAIDGLCVSGGAMLFYHAAANPYSPQASPSPSQNPNAPGGPGSSPPPTYQPPPEYTPPAAPPPPPPPVVGFNLTVARW